MVAWIVENTIVASLLALVVLTVARIFRSRPAALHTLWLAVLVALLLPPLSLPSWMGVRASFHQAGDAAEAWLVGDASEEPVEGAPRRLDAGPYIDGRAVDPMADGLDDELGMDYRSRVAPVALPGGAAPAGEEDGEESPLKAALLLVWFGGSFLVLAFHITRITSFQLSLRRAAPATDSLSTVVRRVAGRSGIRPPRILRMRGLRTPVLWAATRPTLVWPHSLDVEATGARGMVAHEMAHLRRRDHLVAWFEFGALILLWWNPLFWVVRREMRRCSEMACDAWVVHAYPQGRRSYAEALIELAQKLPVAAHPPPVLGFWNGERETFVRRLQLIMSPNASHRVPAIVWVAVLLTAALVLPTPSTAQEKPVSAKAAYANDGPTKTTAAVHAQVIAIKGDALQKAKKYEKAVEVWREVVKLKPDMGKAWRWLGYDMLILGRPADAIEPLRQQVKTGDSREIGFYNLACAHALLGKPDQAMGYLEKSLACGYHNAEHTGKDTDLASLHEREDFKRVVNTMLKVPYARTVAEKAWGEKDFKAAAIAYGKLVEIVKTDGEAYHRLGYCLITGRQLDAAQKAFQSQKALDWKPEFALYNLACVHALAGRPEQALNCLEASVKKGWSDVAAMVDDSDLESLRENARFAALSTRCKEHKTNVQAIKSAFKERAWGKAITACKTMIDFDADFVPGLRLLGKAYLENGDRKLAAKTLKTHIDRGEDVGGALFDMGRIHNTGGNKEAALTSMEQAVACGYYDAEGMLSHKDIENLKPERRFQMLVKRARSAMEWEAKKRTKKKYGEKNKKGSSSEYTPYGNSRVKRL